MTCVKVKRNKNSKSKLFSLNQIIDHLQQSLVITNDESKEMNKDMNHKTIVQELEKEEEDMESVGMCVVFNTHMC